MIIWRQPLNNWWYAENDDEAHLGVVRMAADKVFVLFADTHLTSAELRAIADKLDELNGVEKGKKSDV